MLVEAGIPAAQVVAEAAGRGVDVEEARGGVARVVERVGDVRRDEHERPGWSLERPALERELELALDDEERVGVVVVDVRRGSALTRAVVELGHRQVLRVREQRHAAVRPIGDRLTVHVAGARDDDRSGVGSARGRGRLLVERRTCPRELVLVRGGRESTHERAVPTRGRVEVEERRPALDAERVHDLRRHHDQRARARDRLATFEQEAERPVEHEEALRVRVVDMRRRHRPGSGGEARRGEAEARMLREELDRLVVGGDEGLGGLDARRHERRA